METAARRRSGITHALAEVVSQVFDRLIIPIAVVVGLAGGAMIGTELMQMRMPPVETIH